MVFLKSVGPFVKIIGKDLALYDLLKGLLFPSTITSFIFD